jgi:methionine aminotransferase
MQYAFSDPLERPEHYLDFPDLYQQKRDRFSEIPKASRLELLPCEGTYFQCASFEKISDESDIAFVQRLIEDYKVAAIPVSAFYHDQHDQQVIRFCFAKTGETLEKAGEKLIKV